MSVAVVDTNVVLVANGQHADISPECVKTCVLALQDIMRSGTLPKKGNRPGDAFVKWALNNRCNTKRVDQVPLLEHDERGFESFPEDADLANFDAPDRKFVAVSGAHPDKPSIAQAADSKWLDWAPALQRHGIEVNFLCLADIQRFHENKFGA